MPAPRRSLAALEKDGGGETDNLGYYGRLAAVQGQQVQNERQRDAEFDQATADDPYFAGERRAIKHADIADAGTAQGEAQANAYMAPGQNVARRQKTWDDEEYNKTNGPYSKDAIRGQTELEKAREATRRASLVALTNGDFRVQGQAIRSAGGIAAAQANQGQDVSGTANRINGMLPAAGPSDPAMTVTPEELSDLQAAHPDKTAEEIRAFLASKGYQVPNVPAGR